jgi:hypothetical protein
MAKSEMTLQDAVDIILSAVAEAQKQHPDSFSFELHGDRLTVAIYPVTVDAEGVVTAEEGEP